MGHEFVHQIVLFAHVDDMSDGMQGGILEPGVVLDDGKELLHATPNTELLQRVLDIEQVQHHLQAPCESKPNKG